MANLVFANPLTIRLAGNLTLKFSKNGENIGKLHGIEEIIIAAKDFGIPRLS